MTCHVIQEIVTGGLGVSAMIVLGIIAWRLDK